MSQDPRSRHAHRITVQPGDIDEIGHVNNTVYLRYVEDLTRAHAEHVGMGLSRMRDHGVVPVARRHVIAYHRSARLHDELEVSTQIVHSGGVRAARHNEVRLARDGTLLVEVDTDWVWVDPVQFRPKRVPDAVQSAFGLGAGGA